MPVFDSMDCAARAIANVWRYSARGGNLSTNIQEHLSGDHTTSVLSV